MSYQSLPDLIEKIIKHPEEHGDKFFVQIVKNSQRKAIPINLLHGMAKELYKFPKQYVIDSILSDPRFELNSKHTAVRFTVLPTETDSFGYLAPDTQIETPIADTVALKSTHFEPFYSKIWNSDLQPRQSMLPVFYKDGKFYEDVEPENYHDKYESFVMIPKYQAESIKPLGSEENSELHTPVCFNCEVQGHTFRECSETLYKTTIQTRKKEKELESYGKGRLYDELELVNNTNGMVPGKLSKRLKDSLGMVGEHEEPPYYKNMRVYGYPPGYQNKDSYQLSRQQSSIIKHDDVRFSNEPLLKVFNNDSEDISQIDTSSKNAIKTSSQLAYYPNLFDGHGFQNCEDNRNQTQDSSSQAIDYSCDPNYYYYYYYYYQSMYPSTQALQNPQYQQPLVLPSQGLNSDNSNHGVTCQAYVKDNSALLTEFAPETNEDSEDMDISEEE